MTKPTNPTQHDGIVYPTPHDACYEALYDYFTACGRNTRAEAADHVAEARKKTASGTDPHIVIQGGWADAWDEDVVLAALDTLTTYL